ncbi:D-alanine--poly(phosphoribitol) ligase subunit DltA [Camelliibacillus cellulosilyticus]|uniref:D-alanine--D-alanyl carrier protein ligase n=1 Tax=Camelliibacillus cellulosilyticus TaxID=2174486 RepID=A0ABV9GPF6_9BACL
MKIMEQIDKWAMACPDRLAYQWRNRELSYGELKRTSDALACWISDVLASDHAPIMVYGHMQPEMIVCFLAAVKSGRAYIPVDLSIPSERLAMIAERSGAKLFFALDSTPDLDLPLRIASLEDIQAAYHTYSGSAPQADAMVTGDDNFYIIYTSGSTGHPKGVQITHDCLVSFTRWAIDDFGLGTGQIFMNQAPYSFDLSVMDLYPSLVTGGTLCAVDKDMIARPKDLFAMFANSGIEVWTSTPSFAEMCLTESGFSEAMLPKLHTFLFCGEVLSNNLASKLLDRFPDATVINSYGPTEATVAVTSIKIDRDVIDDYKPLPVGVCKPDCRILIMREDGSIADEGEKGEIVIVGPSVSVGYLGSPELTEAAFTKINGERAYHTKDAGSMVNGLLFCHGRLDFQIKMHGYRMELEEIEHHLRSSRYVRAAVVVPIKRGDQYDHLQAIVVPNEHDFEKEYQLTSAIKKELGTVLPTYMIPRKFDYRLTLPMTANGKVDRKKLLEEVTA